MQKPFCKVEYPSWNYGRAFQLWWVQIFLQQQQQLKLYSQLPEEKPCGILIIIYTVVVTRWLNVLIGLFSAASRLVLYTSHHNSC